MQNGYVARSSVLSARLGLAQGRAELLELACRLMELLVSQAEPGHQGAKVENGSLGDTRGYRDRRLAQDTPHRWGIELANAVLPQQPRQRRLAQARRLGRGRRPCPQRQDPFSCHVITQREKLGVVEVAPVWWTPITLLREVSLWPRRIPPMRRSSGAK